MHDKDILTPLEAADAILHKEPLQEFCEHTGKWFDLPCSFTRITLEILKEAKFRHKPKTILINGVEVPAPLDSTTNQEKVYCIRIGLRDTYKVDVEYGNVPDIYWATQEDAQQVLDAMLISFNKFNDNNIRENHD